LEKNIASHEETVLKAEEAARTSWAKRVDDAKERVACIQTAIAYFTELETKYAGVSSLETAHVIEIMRDYTTKMPSYAQSILKMYVPK
jgi:hypothetical protein